jgi:hypothetical protein
LRVADVLPHQPQEQAVVYEDAARRSVQSNRLRAFRKRVGNPNFEEIVFLVATTVAITALKTSPHKEMIAGSASETAHPPPSYSLVV